MHRSKTRTTKDVSNKMANAPQYIPNDPMPVQQGSIPAKTGTPLPDREQTRDIVLDQLATQDKL